MIRLDDPHLESLLVRVRDINPSLYKAIVAMLEDYIRKHID